MQGDTELGTYCKCFLETSEGGVKSRRSAEAALSFRRSRSNASDYFFLTSGKLRHGPPINHLKSEGGWSISEHFGSRRLKLCQIHILTSCVNLVFFNYVNVVT